MESEHFMGKVSLRALLERDDKVFVCRGIGDTVWQFPGGRMHVGEQPQGALLREILEELGIEVELKQPFYADAFTHIKSGIPQILLFYRAQFPAHKEMTIDPLETEESRWITHEELHGLAMFDDCRKAADEYLRIVESSPKE